MATKKKSRELKIAGLRTETRSLPCTKKDFIAKSDFIAETLLPPVEGSRRHYSRHSLVEVREVFLSSM